MFLMKVNLYVVLISALRAGFKSFSLFVYIAAAAGCSGTDFTDTPKTTEPVTGYASSLMTAEVVGKDAANSYEVQLKFSDLAGGQWFLRKSDAESSKTYVFPLNEKQKSEGFVDPDVFSEKTYSYSLSSGPTSESPATPPLTIEIPRDLKIARLSAFPNSNFDLNIKGYHRLFLDESSVITSDGHALTIEVDEIRSIGGTIQTFEPSKVARLAADGQVPALISIKAKKLVGTLKVILRGEQAGKGQQGAPGETGLPGKTGTETYMGLLGGFCRGRPEIRGEEFQKTHPGRGGVGGQGFTGMPGYPGKQGGRTGSLVVEIPDLDKDQLKIEMILGPGGNGGEGGVGGPGGPGGEGGNIVSNTGCNNGASLCCPLAPKGPTGPQGPSGPFGPAGPVGARGQITINGVASDALKSGGALNAMTKTID
jgi:hypothetical protein